MNNFAPRWSKWPLLAFMACQGGNSHPPVVSYARDVAPLMQEHCVSCHRAGGVGPIDFSTYEATKKSVAVILSAVQSGQMPEGASMRMGTGCADEQTFTGPRKLTEDEIAMLETWSNLGCPMGDPRELPDPLVFEKGTWRGGEPDWVVANTENGFDVPGNLDHDLFRRFVVPSHFSEDRFLTGFEAQPGVPVHGLGLSHTVHHVTLFIDATCSSIEAEKAFANSNTDVPGPGFEGDFSGPATLVGMWFPGAAPLRLAEGLGIRVPKDACVVMEVHYAANHPPAHDKTVVGLHLSTDSSLTEITSTLVKNEQFMVPAGEKEFVVTASRKLTAPLTLHSITPHMHQVGTDMKVTIEKPGEDQTCLADVEWQFEHQSLYALRTPMLLPEGTVIQTTCRYNNSESNPSQFNHPPKDVPFGRSADHEMCQLTIAVSGPE